jgi:hypothetical protein
MDYSRINHGLTLAIRPMQRDSLHDRAGDGADHRQAALRAVNWLLGVIKQMAFDLPVRRVEDSLDVQSVALHKCLKRRGTVTPSHRMLREL